MSELSELEMVGAEWGLDQKELELACLLPVGKLAEWEAGGGVMGESYQVKAVLACAEMMRDFADPDRLDQAVKMDLAELGGGSLLAALKEGRGEEMVGWLASIEAEEPRLTIEMVPGTSWGANVRALLSRGSWDRLRKRVYQEAKGVCEICGEVGERHPLDAHEVWGYDDSTKVQKLGRLIALCPECHEVKHIGRTEEMGGLEDALHHLASVNGWSQERTKLYVEKAFALVEERSLHDWTLDLEVLVTQYGISAEEIEWKLDHRGGEEKTLEA